METNGDVAKCRLFSQASLCLTGRYLSTRTFMAVLVVSILIFVDRRGCTNVQLANSILASKTSNADVLRASPHAFPVLERGAGKNAPSFEGQ